MPPQNPVDRTIVDVSALNPGRFPQPNRASAKPGAVPSLNRGMCCAAERTLADPNDAKLELRCGVPNGLGGAPDARGVTYIGDRAGKYATLGESGRDHITIPLVLQSLR